MLKLFTKLFHFITHYFKTENCNGIFFFKKCSIIYIIILNFLTIPQILKKYFMVDLLQPKKCISSSLFFIYSFQAIFLVLNSILRLKSYITKKKIRKEGKIFWSWKCSKWCNCRWFIFYNSPSKIINIFMKDLNIESLMGFYSCFSNILKK